MKSGLYELFHKDTKSQISIIDTNNFTYRVILPVVNKYIGTKKKILDIGCGAGTLCFYIASKGNSVTGIDISKKAINACEMSAKNLSLASKTSFKVLTFPQEMPKGKFDVVILTEVLEHLEEDKLALRKIYNLLSKNGIAIISTPSKNAPLYKLGLLKKFDERVGHLRRYTMEELIKMCSSVGFEVLETRKEEGIVRNFLFTNFVAGKLLRVVRGFMTDIVTGIDTIACKLFGESDIFIIVRKPK